MGNGMKNPIEHLNKVFDSRIRLGIMSALMVNEEVNFNDLKELIQVTDGDIPPAGNCNGAISSHIVLTGNKK